MFGVEEFLQAHAHFGVIILGDKAFEDAVLHRQTIPFKEFMDFRSAPVVFDIVGYKNKLHHHGNHLTFTISLKKYVIY